MKQETQIIRVKNKTATDYQYQDYKDGWILEVINEYDEHYVAKVLTGSVQHTDSVMAVHKGDCEEVHLGSYKSNGPTTMEI
jgi:hypothetical protein